jgi:CDP-diacylglycerol---glycerol-3-phosphate 3-phosphatidyltransferase
MRCPGKPVRSPVVASPVNLPNVLTVLRCALTPVCILAIADAPSGWSIDATLVFAVAALTDALDGSLARSRGQITRVGQVIDPIADKLLICGCLLALVVVGRAPLWVWIAIASRELTVTVLRYAVHREGRLVPASNRGKVKMRFQVAAVLAAILVPVSWSVVTLCGMAAAVAITWWSGLGYVAEFREHRGMPAWGRSLLDRGVRASEEINLRSRL